MEEAHDWESQVHASFEPGSTRISRRTVSSQSGSGRKADRCVIWLKVDKCLCRKENDYVSMVLFVALELVDLPSASYIQMRGWRKFSWLIEKSV